MTERGLGRRPPTDDRHVRLYGLTTQTMPTAPTPVILGTNWYAGFDAPDAVNGKFWLPPESRWGQIRGGHCYCLIPDELYDLAAWWGYYDQGTEGACVGFGCSRGKTLLERVRFDGFWLYNEARKIDEWDGTDYDGTSVRAACDVLRTMGHRRVKNGQGLAVNPDYGIAANRWAVSPEEVAACLSPSDQGKKILDRGWVQFLNSWGRDGYPHKTRMPLEHVRRLAFREDGDVTIWTDR